MRGVPLTGGGGWVHDYMLLLYMLYSSVCDVCLVLILQLCTYWPYISYIVCSMYTYIHASQFCCVCYVLVMLHICLLLPSNESFYRLIADNRMGVADCKIVQLRKEANSKQNSYMTLFGVHSTCRYASCFCLVSYY